MSVAVGVSVLGMTALAGTQASGCNHHSSCTVERREESYSYVNPQEHCVSVTEEHFCYGCQDYHYAYDTYYEGHDYDLDEATGIMTCDWCGDSYKW